MNRIIIFRKLDDHDIQELEGLMLNENIPYEISKISNSLTIEGNNDALAHIKRILINHGFEII
ncbi:MAG: hypothetical protein ACI4U3_05290 [Traorella sp.]